MALTTEVLIDKDMNIGGTFGVCNSPRFAGLSSAKTIQVSASESLYGVAKPVTGHMCYMQLAQKWGSLTKEVVVYDSGTKEYREIPTTNSYILCHYGGGCIYPIDSGQRVTINTKGSGSVPSDVLSLMNALIDSTWGISDSAAEAWILSTNTAVIKKYGLNSTNIGEVTVAIKAAGVSPVLFYAYTVNEGGGLGSFINHYGGNYYANNGGDTAVNAANGDAQYLADQSKIMNSRPAWVDLGQKPPLRIDFVPQSVKDSGNASFASMPSGSIGRAYIPATAAATWEVYYPDGLLKSYNQVQNYGAPMKGVLSFIEAMSKY